MNKTLMTFLAVLTVGLLVSGARVAADTTTISTPQTIWDDTVYLIGPNADPAPIQASAGSVAVATQKVYNGITIPSPATTVTYDPGSNTTNTTTVSYLVEFDVEYHDVPGPAIGGLPWTNRFDIIGTVNDVVTFNPGPPAGISGSASISVAPFTTAGTYKFTFTGEQGITNYHVIVQVWRTVTTAITPGPP